METKASDLLVDCLDELRHISDNVEDKETEDELVKLWWKINTACNMAKKMEEGKE